MATAFETFVNNEIGNRIASQEASQTALYFPRYTGIAKLTTERSPAQLAADINAIIAAATIIDHAVIRGDGGARGAQDSTVIIADNGVLSVPGIGSGAVTAYDLRVGNVTTPDYGMVQIGNARFGRTSFDVGAIDLNGAVLISNLGGPVTGDIEIIFTESTGGTCRFAIPKSGVGLATYNPRSMLIAGPAPADTDFVKVAYWRTQGIFDNIPCDTVGSGADLGVQGSLEVETFIYVDVIKESTTGVGVAVDGLLLKDTTIEKITLLKGVTDNILALIESGGTGVKYIGMAAADAGGNPAIVAIGPAGDVDLEITAQGATGQVIIGPPGDIMLGDSTERNMYPETDVKVNLGTPTNQFNDLYAEHFYGEMHAINQTVTVTIGVVDTHVELGSGFTSDHAHGFTFQTAKELKCTTAGKYTIGFSVSGQSVSANQEFEAAVMLNGTALSEGSGHSTMPSANKTTSLSGHLILNLAVDDVIKLSMANHTGTANFTMEHSSLVVSRVGN